MILELLIRIIGGLISFIGSLFPTISLPSWWSTLGERISDLMGFAAGFGAFIPFAAAGQALVFVLAAVAVAVGIKLVRIVASFLTAGGGSAA